MGIFNRISRLRKRQDIFVHHLDEEALPQLAIRTHADCDMFNTCLYRIRAHYFFACLWDGSEMCQLPPAQMPASPQQLYQQGGTSERSGSAPASPVSHGASSSPASSPGAVGSPYSGSYRGSSAMGGGTSPLQQQMEQFRVASSLPDDRPPSRERQYYVVSVARDNHGSFCNYSPLKNRLDWNASTTFTALKCGLMIGTATLTMFISNQCSGCYLQPHM